MNNSQRPVLCLAAGVASVLLLGLSTMSVAEELFVSRPLTESGAFTPGIEGPACDAGGNVYAVNFQKQGTIGRVTPSGEGSVYVTLPNDSVGNGIRFDRQGTMYIADYVNHNVLKVDPETKEISVHAHEDRMNQPNDLAIGPDGTLWASDPNWGQNTGQIWRIDADGKTTLAAEEMGTTNGIEVSPDGKTLYVNESVQRNVWAFTITGERELQDKRLVKQFPDHGFDGMRCDVDGNLYITRYGKGTVVKMSPEGEILQEIDVLGARPSNLCFGGPDGRTVYVTEVEHTRIVAFRVDRPGLAWRRWVEAGETGSQELFNGKDLDNWAAFSRDPDTKLEDVWSVEEGVLVCRGTPVGYLHTKEEFDNYLLSVEWRWPQGSDGGNSGVLVHTTEPNALGVWPRSIEVQLHSGNAGDFWVIGTELDVPNAEERRKGRRHLKLKDGAEKPIGQWNRMVIVCRDDAITVFVNGQLVNEGSKASQARGQISLQSEGAPIQFRNIRLTPLEEIESQSN